ncbi:MAG: hypothetical protein ACI4GC_08750 [Acutalibacteraceae bacterium]
MNFDKFAEIWQALWAWIYKALEYFGLDLADGNGNGVIGNETTDAE